MACKRLRPLGINVSEYWRNKRNDLTCLRKIDRVRAALRLSNFWW